MNGACTAERRRRCHCLKRDLEALDIVRDVDVLAPHEGQQDGWTVSAILVGRRIPPVVCEAVAAADVDLLPDATGSRGEPLHTELVAIA